jgi:acetyl-CoA carboxylase carboxyl transferase subunit beta
MTPPSGRRTATQYSIGWKKEWIMAIHELFVRRKKNLNTLLQLRKNEKPQETCDCPKCGAKLNVRSLARNTFICPDCNYYFLLGAKERIHLIADEKSFKEYGKGLATKNPLDFPGYGEKLSANQKKCGNEDAIITGVCTINGITTALGVLDGKFLMGSMGTVVGERVAGLAEYAMKKKLPLVIFSASGGARMQEGMFSLMQMAKTSAAIQRFKDAGGLFVSVLTNPTTGGVSASFATLGDIIIAEPDALICFAGPRVIEQTIGEKLPEGFQRSEFLLEHGMIDMVVERRDMKNMLHKILSLHV